MYLKNISYRLTSELQRCDLLVPECWDECRRLGVFIHDDWYKCLRDTYTALGDSSLKLKSRYIWLHTYYYVEKWHDLDEANIVRLSYLLIGDSPQDILPGAQSLVDTLYDQQD